ncbi:MAG TPA: carbon-nitrogen hydrolase family protein [Planctomycetota bacterium]|nr:carbon-nitrogen hydrolase family protein [Planctomycetota bacterium]
MSDTAEDPPRAAEWKPRLTVAAAQMEVRADIDRNRRVILEQIDEAARKHKARLIVFPETAISGYAPAHCTGGTCDTIDFRAVRKAEQEMRGALKRHRMWGVLGTTECRKGRYYNTALIVDPKGRVAGRYDKIHLTGQRTRTLDTISFSPGAKSCLKTHKAAGTRVGVQICFDMRFPESWRTLALQGARILVHPTAAFGRDSLWKREGIEANLSSRASENSCWLVSANSAGPYQYMASRIVDPDGIVIAKAEVDAEQVISAKIDPDWLGRAGGFLSSRRPDCYKLK